MLYRSVAAMPDGLRSRRRVRPQALVLKQDIDKDISASETRVRPVGKGPVDIENQHSVHGACAQGYANLGHSESASLASRLVASPLDQKRYHPRRLI
jgi:hypothetical protein